MSSPGNGAMTPPVEDYHDRGEKRFLISFLCPRDRDSYATGEAVFLYILLAHGRF